MAVDRLQFLVIIMLLYMEFEGFVRHMRLHDKLKVLAAQSLINIQKLSQSLIRSSKKVSGASPDGEKSAAADTARSSGPSAIPTRSPFEGVPVSQVKEGKPSASQNKHSGLSMLKSMVTTVQEFALEGGERYLQEIEEAERKSAQDLAQSNVSSATDKPKDSWGRCASNFFFFQKNNSQNTLDGASTYTFGISRKRYLLTASVC